MAKEGVSSRTLVVRPPGSQANRISPQETPALPGEEMGRIDPSTY